MAQSLSSSNQGVIAVNAGSGSAGTTITLTDSNGKTVLTHETDQSFALIVLSSPDIESGKTYTLAIGSYSQSVTAD